MSTRLRFPLPRRKESEHRPHLAVIRHAEREDTASKWCHDALQQVCWQSDPALSPKGIKQASSIASEISLKSQAKFDVVVTSPYFRCVQTAIEICKHVGTDSSLLVDASLGEVYGSEVLGDEQPKDGSLLREFDDVRRYCQENGITIRTQVVGTWPRWGEHIGTARVRFVRRFLQYLHRSQRTGLSFALVTHGDGVAAMMSVMPAMQGRVIKRVDFAGYFLAHASVPTPLPDRSGVTELITDSHVEDSTLSSGSGPSACDAQTWRVSYSSVKVGAPLEESFARRISRWSTKFGYAEKTIKSLLLYRRQADGPNVERTSALATSDLPAISTRDLASLGSGQTLQDDDAASDVASSVVFFQTSSPCKFYQHCGVSPLASPSKSYALPISSMTPTKAYVKAGVSPVHTPVKAYKISASLPSEPTKISL